MNLRKLTTTTLLLLSAGSPAFAQDEEEKRVLEPGKWYPTLESGINFTQSSYSDNWAGGDRGSIVWTWILNGTLENQLSSSVNTLNTLKLAFGQTHQQRLEDDDVTRSWDRPEKSTDLIDFESLWRLTFGWVVDPFVAGRFESQFQDASDPDRTIALNPLKFKETAGLARKFIDEEERSLLSRVGFSFRQSSRKSFVNEAPDETTRSETSNDGGVEWTTDYKTKVLDDRVSWTSKLTFYQPVFYSGKDELEALSADYLSGEGVDPDVATFTTAMDIDWENIFTTQITKLISVNLYLKFIYDKYDNTVAPEPNEAGDELVNIDDVEDAIRKAGQFKQTLSIGVTYRFL